MLGTDQLWNCYNAAYNNLTQKFCQNINLALTYFCKKRDYRK